jgi:hypothetical protein
MYATNKTNNYTWLYASSLLLISNLLRADRAREMVACRMIKYSERNCEAGY